MVCKGLPFLEACFLTWVERLVEEWSRFDHEIINFLQLLSGEIVCVRACVKVGGGHFEQFTWTKS